MLKFCSRGDFRLCAHFRSLCGDRVGAAGVPMLIEVEELQLHPIDFLEEFSPGVIDLGSDIRQRSTLRSEGHADLVEEHHGRKRVIQDIRLKGRLEISLELACARCVEPVVQAVSRNFELLYRPLGADAGHEELSVTDAEAEIGYYQGEGVLLEDVLREQILLAVPLKIVCREDCRGLCPQCGKNWNEAQCSCETHASDPRWDALKNIREKLQQ